MTIVPRIVDIYHGDTVASDGFARAKAAGIWAVIHKATQGAAYKDPLYDARRKQASDNGLLWGAYHFNTGEDLYQQALNFCTFANPDDNTCMVLDFEDNPKGNMSVHEAVSFMKLVEDKTGRECMLYSGNRIKETINTLPTDEFAYITSRRLWLCEYGANAVLPKGYDKYYIWQYTGDGMGPLPHYVDGISVAGGRGIDLNIFDATIDELKASWAGGEIVLPQDIPTV